MKLSLLIIPIFVVSKRPIRKLSSICSDNRGCTVHVHCLDKLHCTICVRLHITFLQDESEFSGKIEVRGKKYFQQLNNLFIKAQCICNATKSHLVGWGSGPTLGKNLGIVVHFEQPRKFHIFFSLRRQRAYDKMDDQYPITGAC